MDGMPRTCWSARWWRPSETPGRPRDCVLHRDPLECLAAPTPTTPGFDDAPDMPTSSPKPAADAPVRVLHLTDPHLFDDAAATLYGRRTSDTFGAVVAQALARAPARPDAILVTGDIGDDCSAGAYRRFAAVLRDTGIPAWCLPGNHDDPAQMAATFARGSLRYAGVAALRGWRLLLLESPVPGEPHGELGAARLAALERDLAACAGRPQLVAIHHPPQRVGSAWIDAMGLRDGAALLELLRRHPDVRGLVSGHVHQASDQAQGGLRLLTTPSTCAQFLPGSEEFALDAQPPGWRWLELQADGRIETEVFWLEGTPV